MAGSVITRSSSSKRKGNNQNPLVSDKQLDKYFQTEVIRNEIKQVKESFEQKIFDLDTKQKDYESRLDSVEKSLEFAHNQIDQLQKDLSSKDHNLINIEKKRNNSEAENIAKTLEIQTTKRSIKCTRKIPKGVEF